MSDQSDEPTQFKLAIPNVELSVSAQDVVSNMSLSDTVNLIMEMDDEMAQWESTLILFRYFRDQVEGKMLSLIDSTSPEDAAFQKLLELDDSGLWEELSLRDEEREADSDLGQLTEGWT